MLGDLDRMVDELDGRQDTEMEVFAKRYGPVFVGPPIRARSLPLPISVRTTGTMLKVGIFDHLDDAGTALGRQYEERLLLAEACDAAGFHAYHVAEHHGTPHGIAASTSVFLSAVAQRTTRLRLGPLVMLLTLQHPLRCFEEICMLDQMSGGRVEFGIGRGASAIELGFFGVDADHAQDRYQEAVDIVLRAMLGGSLTYEGRFFDLREVPISLAPLQRPYPPVWYGTNRPESTAWAARNGVNLVSYGPAEAVRAVTDAYRAQLRAADAADMPDLGMTRHIVIAENDAEARALAAPAYARWCDTLSHLERGRGIALPPKLPLTFAAAAASGVCLAGSAATVRDALRRQVRTAGITYLLCQPAFGDLPLAASLATVAAIRREIMPAFAEFEQGAAQRQWRTSLTKAH